MTPDIYNDRLAEAAIHARTRRFRSKAGKARGVLEDWLGEHGTTMICWSGGKDSTALALLASGLPGAHIAHFESGLEFPGVLDWMSALADTREWNYKSWFKRDAMAAMIENGSWSHHTEHTTYDSGAWWESTIGGPRDIALTGTGAKTMAWGLRADESAGRRVRIAQGLSFLEADTRVPVVCPLGWWDTIDVWAAHLAAGIEPCPVYRRLCEIGCPEQSQRLDTMTGADGIRMGRMVWLKRGWPDEWARLTAKLPRMTEWA